MKEKEDQTIVEAILDNKFGLGLPDDVIDDLEVDEETKKRLREEQKRLAEDR